METLQITLLGGFAASQKGRPINGFRSAKARALLAYLAVQPEQEHLRANLAALFWGDLPEQTARTNLRIELSHLKKLLSAHPVLAISRQAVHVDQRYLSVDVLEFRAALTGFMMLAAEARGNQLHRLEAAISIYQGEFLAGFNVSSTDGTFHEWRLLIQEQLHQQLMRALEILQQHYAEQGRWPELASAARQQLAIVPWSEPAHRYRIQALAAQGQIRAALDQYQTCIRILQEELGVEPAPATREMAASLQDNRTLTPPVRHNLMRPLTSMIGREDEQARLHALVQNERLVTLFGMGGAGKSRLAQAVGADALAGFADGIWFVPLANIEAGAGAPDRIVLAIAAAIGFHITAVASPVSELAAHFADKHTLLILDNWEHLTAAAEAVLLPLLQTRGVHILATSRIRLALENETPVLLSGLAQTPSFTLFVERARRVTPDFAVDDMETQPAADVAAICEQLQGLPLGIELAASWVEHFTVAEIGAALAAIEVAPDRANELISRHHSLGRVLEYSWQLLSPDLQQILSRCCVFLGGFERSAASTVAGCSLHELSALIGHSLVQRVAAGRYQLHPLVQEFAAAKLAPAAQTLLHQRYRYHYLQALCASERAQRADRLLVDFQNIRSAWQHAISAGDDRLIRQATLPFGEFIAQFGLMNDGYQLFEQAVQCFVQQPEQAELVARLLDQQWVFSRAVHGLSAASSLQHRLLTLTGDRQLQVKTHLDLANRYAEEGRWQQTDTHFEQAETLTRDLSDPRLYIQAIKTRIHVNALQFRGDFAVGIAELNELLALLDNYTESSAALHRESENLRIDLRKSLSLLACRYGDYALSIRCGRQNLAWIEDLGHQQQKIGILLDLALSEQFAGLYPQAIAHNQEALQLAEAIGANDDIGLLQANLCLTLRQRGDLEQALIYGHNAVATLNAIGLVRMEGQARNRVAHTLSALERWDDAYAAYADALAVWESLQHPNRFEAMAGRAVAAGKLARTDESLALAGEVVDFVATAGLQGLVEPVSLSLNCAAVLTETGQPDRARQVVQQAAAWVQMIAGRISDGEIRKSYLHNRPDNQLLASRT